MMPCAHGGQDNGDEKALTRTCSSSPGVRWGASATRERRHPEVVLTALHSHQDLATRQSANCLLHDADTRGGLAQALAELAAHRRRKDIRDATGNQLQNCAIEGWQTLPSSLQSGVVVDFGSGVRQSRGRPPLAYAR